MNPDLKHAWPSSRAIFLYAIGVIAIVIFVGMLFPRVIAVTPNSRASKTTSPTATTQNTLTNQANQTTTTPPIPPLDTAAYDQKMLQLANLRVITVTTTTRVSATSTATTTKTFSKTVSSPWPVKAPYPNAGALLPFNRIVAYYGNFYSTHMGVLGEYPPDQVLQMLASTTAMWQTADPTTPVIPAIDYIAVTAQGSAGTDGMYRLRMPASQIDKAIAMAQQINGVVFLDVQIGLSTVQKEIPLLEPYLKLPQVHLSLDPEFAMHNGERPGTVIGTMDATDINWTSQYLANLVRQNNLPPKILAVHRFTEEMVTNYKNIQPLPEVQIVMDMDGFGFPAKKINTYQRVIVPEPVEFTGFKLFYVNDAEAPSSHLMSPAEVLKLSPQPSYIQYQ